MPFDYITLESLRTSSPAWRLLASPHAPLIASFLHKEFIATNEREIKSSDLVEALEDELYALRLQAGENSFPRTALEYLDEWASDDKGWLRKFYPKGSGSEAVFDLTPHTEKAISWLGTLSERSFVGTESRLLTLFELLKQISQGSESDPAKRLEELQKRRSEIDAEISNIIQGKLSLLDETSIKDRFQQFYKLAHDLLSDFRVVEGNFRRLDRHVREQIALWDGSKGELLEEIMKMRDAIVDSDEGRSFRAFWSFLMSNQGQQQLSEMLERVLELEPVKQLNPDLRIRRIHYDWQEAGQRTQQTIAQLSQQLRRFLDDRIWLENRRIIELLHNIEKKAVDIAKTNQLPTNEFMTIDNLSVNIDLFMERPLYTPKIKALINTITAESSEESDIPIDAIYKQSRVNSLEITNFIKNNVQQYEQITLKELIDKQPLTQGLAELLTYLQLGNSGAYFKMLILEEINEPIMWEVIRENNDSSSLLSSYKQAKLPRIIFMRL